MNFMITIFVCSLLFSSCLSQQEDVAMRCGFLYYLPCLKPQLDRENVLLGLEGPQVEYIQRLRDFPYNPPSYGEKKSHSKSFRPRIPLLRY